MKRLYWPHPNDWDIGGMERFYARMARRGWQLEKRGAFFSRFIRKEPEEVCYRVELASSSGNFGEVQLPPEQIQLYEECGWQYVTGRGLVHLFRAPAGSGEPELYDDPRQQADTLQGLRREARHQLIGACVQTAIYLLLVCLNWSGRFADMRITCLQAPTLVPLALILMGSLLAGALHQVISLGRQYRRMRLGQPLDRRPQWGWRTIQGGFWAAGAVCVAFLVWQAVGTRTLMPVAGQVGPCLVLEQLGEEGELTNLPVREGRESSIRVTPLLGRALVARPGNPGNGKHPGQPVSGCIRTEQPAGSSRAGPHPDGDRHLWLGHGDRGGGRTGLGRLRCAGSGGCAGQ